MIRPLTPADDDAYRQLWALANGEDGDDTPRGIPTRFDDDSWTLGAFDGARLVGIVSIEREAWARLRHKALLSRMFIHPDSAGSGLGKVLLHEALLRATRMPELRQVRLAVLENNEPAQRLYASAGFRSYSHEPEAVRIGDHYVAELQMVRFLRRERRD